MPSISSCSTILRQVNPCFIHFPLNRTYRCRIRITDCRDIYSELTVAFQIILQRRANEVVGICVLDYREIIVLSAIVFECCCNLYNTYTSLLAIVYVQIESKLG